MPNHMLLKRKKNYRHIWSGAALLGSYYGNGKVQLHIVIFMEVYI
jgi:hypothetical protein